MIYWQLFMVFLKVGAFGFGGGYAALPLISQEIVVENQWLTMQEFNELITISQMTPGPIVINSATFVGTQVAGVTGALVATFGSVLPSIIIVTLMAYLYMKYRQLDVLQYIFTSLRPAVVALIATAAVSILVTSFWGTEVIGVETVKITAVFIFGLCLFLLMKTRMSPIAVMILAGVLNVVAAIFTGNV